MGHFDACEACGTTEYLVVGGLCFDCNQDALRAEWGSSTLRRVGGTSVPPRVSGHTESRFSNRKAEEGAWVELTRIA